MAMPAARPGGHVCGAWACPANFGRYGTPLSQPHRRIENYSVQQPGDLVVLRSGGRVQGNPWISSSRRTVQAPPFCTPMLSLSFVRRQMHIACGPLFWRGHDNLLVVLQSVTGVLQCMPLFCTATMTISLSFFRASEAYRSVAILLHGGDDLLHFQAAVHLQCRLFCTAAIIKALSPMNG